MSYMLCKSIAIKGNVLEVNVASNNVYPKIYHKTEYKIGKCNLEQNLFWLFTDLMNGELHLNSSVYKYNYAYYKALDFLKENKEEFNNIYGRENDYYYEKIKELINIDLRSDYYRNEELKNRYNKFREENGELIEQLEYESAYKVYGKVFKIFKQALKEKEDNTLYTLYSDTYKYIKLKGSNGAFYYGYSNAVEKGKYKEMYVKAKMVGRDIQLKRVVLTDKEIQKELENEKLKEQAKEKIKDIEQVKRDLVEFKNNRLSIDKYYLKELCELFGIKERMSDKKVTIPKNLIHIEKNGYKFTGKHSRKMSAKIDHIRKELLKVVENV